jgi:hypothetical protein
VHEEYEQDGHTYQMRKLGLSDGKDVTARLMKGGIEDLLSERDTLDWLERKLFGENCLMLNDQGEWLPLGKALTDSHFAGRTDSYMGLLMECFRYNFKSFLAGGWLTSLAEEADEAG